MFKRIPLRTSLLMVTVFCIAPTMASNYISFDTAPLPKGCRNGRNFAGNINLSRGLPTTTNSSSSLVEWGINITTNLAIYGVQTLWNMKKESEMEKIEAQRKAEEKAQQEQEYKTYIRDTLNEYFQGKEDAEVVEDIHYAQQVLDEFKEKEGKEQQVQELREGMRKMIEKFKENSLLK